LEDFLRMPNEHSDNANNGTAVFELEALFQTAVACCRMPRLLILVAHQRKFEGVHGTGGETRPR
jgi:hypothetical protein